ncbi:biotin/lipoyl-containing protein [Streptomyces griseoloalbus]|uniref:Pyruvate/2-oxoglutarate dehydrogenase complex dihydrolipoamide acyltransferase (E2) component n=1 Tax=Streptomyces griseoloalbus TaxID=67303 RepID=A0A7W8BNM4_9ACTN|nr:biotin/lipoyl-containing protein [Streptomyces albaduncus]MBB5125233.1 pyruvate/2-oxoglutarate dehydrogenase complex dihydrolipoamide acyltransferase (E2) component [Streptomyces albaduncus]GGW29127.1 hypothetical protein GCM10010340_03460 [Streptomyces albaduncus]
MSMTVLVKRPKLGLTTQEGELLEWLVSDGDTVEAGQTIYLLGTDKVEHEVEAETKYQVGDVLAKITPA